MDAGSKDAQDVRYFARGMDAGSKDAQDVRYSARGRTPLAEMHRIEKSLVVSQKAMCWTNDQRQMTNDFK